ncbi:apoptosis facilitator Bcl-2-like protein 14 [Salvelinus fontinalis]|uniref:apoptosis facilitator Bcl-2-like protein 14 n=1 Tax=Salvelinus fontinalis TaxID=8038 RepID=UPI0024869B4D|nr:apoptosis facilitator Bcl-2-like protein 14 [Salvelinus fontinalis]XP_055793994.1 apoptosis facilitator Bcl-2-like protein 14 [Salvelinus fontinalis]
MANSNANGSTNSNVNGSAKAGLPGDMDGMEDSVEFRLMMVYAQRRRPREVLCPLPQGTDTQPGGTQTLEVHADTLKKKKKKKGMRMRLQSLLSCIRPHRDSTAVASGPPRTPSPPPTGTQRSSFRSFGNVRDELEKVADRLTQIADGVSFSSGDLETDGEEDAIERLVGLLLRGAGDKLNEEVLKDASLSSEFFGYSLYERTISTFLSRLGLTSDPSTPGSPRAQIALTCEVTSRLSAVDSLPMSRVLGFGAKYLQDHFSSWAIQQGGYEEAFVNDDEEVD